MRLKGGICFDSYFLDQHTFFEEFFFYIKTFMFYKLLISISLSNHLNNMIL